MSFVIGSGSKLVVSNGPSISVSRSGVPIIALFIKTLGGAGNDQGRGTAVDGSGNIIMSGTTGSQGAGNIDMFVAKYNTSGIVQWQRAMGTASSDGGSGGSAAGPSDDVYFVGSIFLPAPNFTTAFISKFNSSGTIQWQRTLANGVASLTQFFTCAVDSSGNVYAVGRDVALSPGGGIIVKYNSSGTIQWQRTFQGSLGGGTVKGVAIDSTGSNIYVVGSDVPVASQVAVVAKYNSSGTLQWQRSLGGAGQDEFTGCVVDNSDNVYCVGEQSSEGQGGSQGDAIVAKYDSTGTIQWQRILGDTNNNFRSSIAIDSSSNVYISFETTGGPTSISMAKYNSSGTLQWQRDLSASVSDTPGQNNGIVHAGSGKFVVAGSTSPTEILLFKAPDDGTLTATYGSYVYAVSALTGATSTLTDAAGVMVDGAGAMTDAAGIATITNTTLTEISIEP